MTSKLIKIRIAKKDSDLFLFSEYCMKNKIDTLISWIEEDLFDPVVLSIIYVPNEVLNSFINKFRKNIISYHELN